MRLARTLLNDASFNPSIGLTSVPTTMTAACCPSPAAFQSLNRAYKRSDQGSEIIAQIDPAVSIPQSGLQAFRPPLSVGLDILNVAFQSLNRAYKRSDLQRSVGDWRIYVVSIPQSGLQAFRRRAGLQGAVSL